MRKVTFILALIGAFAVSCTKEASLDEVEKVENEPTDPQVVEEIIVKTLGEVQTQTTSDYTTFQVIGEFFTEAIPEYGVLDILEPVAEQIYNCYQNDTLKVGLSNITGHFQGGFEAWKYTEADDLQFIYPNSANDIDKIAFAASKEVTKSPLYQLFNVVITLPKEINASVSVNDENISKTKINSEYFKEDSYSEGDFKLAFGSKTNLTSTGVVSFQIEDEDIEYLKVGYDIVNKDGIKLISVGYLNDLTAIDYVNITLYDRVMIDVDFTDLKEFFSGLVLYNVLLQNDPSRLNVEYVKAKVAELNKELDIHFYLDGIFKGYITMEVTQDNGYYMVDVVMTYEGSEEKYQLHDAISWIIDLYQECNSTIDMISAIIDFFKGQTAAE